MIRPEEIKILGRRGVPYDLNELEFRIDTDMKLNHCETGKWENAQLTEELPLEVRNLISKRYIEAGWGCVCHRTSFENHEMPGLTAFMFFTKDQDPFELYPDFENSNWNLVKEDE